MALLRRTGGPATESDAVTVADPARATDPARRTSRGAARPAVVAGPLAEVRANHYQRLGFLQARGCRTCPPHQERPPSCWGCPLA